ncbi:MAG TPA: cytochrome c [Prolixibacteraceae bacterium]
MKLHMLIKTTAGTAVIFLCLTAFKQTNEWKAPVEADKLINPFTGNAVATAKGKTLYITYCTVCHGTTGKGDGPVGGGLTPKPANHSSQKVQSQTDGTIFWKLTNGRAPMAAYKDILKEEQRWQLVNYIRELGKTTTSSTVKKN